MKGLVLSQNHVALSSSDSMKEICKPLDKLNINYFSFVRSYHDGSHIRLSNNYAWTNHYYNRGFYNIVLKQVPDKEGNLLWSNIDKYPLFYEAAEYYNVDNGTVIVLTIDDVTERYFFGSTKSNNGMNHFYIHHLDLLKKFILYFKETARILIAKAEESKIFIQKIETNEAKNNIDENLVEDFLNDIKINKICVRVKEKDFYISNNEAKILTLMKCGYTAKEISSEINLSKKTVEIYRDKLKNKLDLFSRGNLISFAQENTLLNMDLLTDTSKKL